MSTSPHQSPPQLPVDRAAIGAIGLLSLAVAGVLLVGQPSQKPVQSFSWANQIIGVDDAAFSLVFDAPMDWDSVVENLSIDPPLKGEVSWVGQRLAYTLTDLPEYGKQYTLKLSQAQTRPLSPRQAPQTLPDFTAEFQVRDRAFAYIGVRGEEQGRLVLFNLTTGKRLPLTPTDLVVTNFRPSADGRAIVFLAFAKNAPDGINQQQLYRVTTGHRVDNQEPEIPGLLELILDADRYENRQFALSAAAETLIVERINRQNPDTQGLWLISASGTIQSLGQQSDNFQLSPDGEVLAVSQPTGVTLLPLTSRPGPRVSFPNYEALLAFSRQDQRRKIMVRNNGDLTRSLMLITPNGQEREILRTGGFILRCEFEPRQEKFLYCIQAEAIDAEQTQIQPFLTLVNLATGNVIPLVALTDDRDVRMDVAPDGRTLLFDQVTAEPEIPVSPNAIPQGSLWLVNLPDFTQRRRTHALESPDNVAAGLDPQWLP
ncbi:MAG: hypothetical protein F6J87_22795 [Spirulina sp. SIO3F2]|nr:hypothetical protein [Spirulina sp. SIO3F2]